MFDLLNKVCSDFIYTNENKFKGQIFMIIDTWIQSGSFLQFQFIGSYLKQNQKIIIICFEWQYSFLVQLLRKQGVNLEQKVNKNEVIVFLVNEKSGNYIKSEIPLTEQRPLGYIDRNNKVKTINLQSEQCLDDILKQIHSITDQYQDFHAIFIDNLYFMINLIQNKLSILQFISTLNRLAFKININVHYLQTYDQDDHNSQIIMNKLQEFSQFNLKCMPLQSGYSQEVQGQVQFEIIKNQQIISSQFLFQLNQNGFSIFDSYKI